MGLQPPGCVDRRVSPVRLALLALALGFAATASFAQNHSDETQGPRLARRPQGFNAAASERNIRELKRRLDAAGDRRTGSGATPVFRE